MTNNSDPQQLERERGCRCNLAALFEYSEEKGGMKMERDFS
jgi:hypothetical protein